MAAAGRLGAGSTLRCVTAPWSTQCHGLLRAQHPLPHTSSCTSGAAEPSGSSGYGSRTADTLGTVQECSARACKANAVCLSAWVESGTCLFCDWNGDACQGPANREPNLPFGVHTPMAARGIHQRPDSGSCRGCCSRPPRT